MQENVTYIPIQDLYPFRENPFQVADNEELEAITESIREYGVLNPLIVRPRESGGYEIISGHRRKRACELAGIDKIPAFVREMERNEAVIALVDSNLYREHILPSEKAFAFKMKLDAIKQQGHRSDLTSRQVVGKSESADIIGQESKESGRTVQRYIRLTELLPSLLQLVDQGKIAFSPAVELSYLTETEQRELLETMESEECTPSLSQAQRMKKLSAEKRLNIDVIFSILTEEKPNQREQIKLKKEQIQGFFPKAYTAKQMEDTILKLLADWQKKRTRSRNEGR